MAPSSVLPSFIFALASTKTLVNRLLCFETRLSTFDFKISNSCRSPSGVGPEIIKGVRASSTKTESTSSTIA